jgi:hypothetical protein
MLIFAMLKTQILIILKEHEIMALKNNDIARIIYSAIKAYSESIGEYCRYPHWDNIPNVIYNNYIASVEWLKLNQFSDASDLHERYCGILKNQGWEYGVEMDLKRKTHPKIMEFHTLPIEQQAKTHLFKEIFDALLEVME